MDASSNQLPKEPKELKLDLKASPSALCTAGLDLVRPARLGQALSLYLHIQQALSSAPGSTYTNVRYACRFLNLRAEVHRLSCILAPSTKPTPCDKPSAIYAPRPHGLSLVLAKYPYQRKTRKVKQTSSALTFLMAQYRAIFKP